MANIIETNDFNTKITEELFNSLKQEIREEFLDIVSTIDFIKKIISPNIKRACDLERDEKGKIIIDVTDPHKLEDMDYFRPSALHFMKTGRYTDYRPSKVPSSPFRKWISEERRRCYEGYVRESDGEWITGDHYFFLNYCPMQMIKEDKEAGISVFTQGFPQVMDGQYYLFHYIWQARKNNLMSLCLASRQRGKSATAGGMLAKRIILGETALANKFISSMVIAGDKKYLVGANTILNRFVAYIDHCAKTTQWPSKRIRNTENNQRWEIGYMNNDGTKGGVQNIVMGMSAGDDPGKPRGSRASLYVLEEIGNFPHLKELYRNLLPSVKNGNVAYGMMHLIGTAGDKDSDFEGAKELFYNPLGYEIYGVRNVWDKASQGRSLISFFYPAYMNIKDYYDKDGNSNVTGALIQLLEARFKVKYNSSDPLSLIKECAENPIYPEEAMMKTRRSFFPVTELNERIKQLENDSGAFDEVEVGELFFKDNGTVDFKHTRDLPIRFFPHSDNKIRGAVEIFHRPVVESGESKPMAGRYIASLDPIDKDNADTMSLSSTFVFDLYTDTIVAEYTGRRELAVENYEITRMLCHYYNAQCYFENNLLGFKSYMQSKGDLVQYVAKTPNNLKTQGIAPRESLTTSNYGIRTTSPVIDQMNLLIRDWMTDEIPAEDVDGNEIKTKNLYLVKNIALLKELVMYNDKDNFDRCVLKGTKILTKNGFKFIEDIKKNNLVLTSSGNYCKVVNTMKNKFVGLLVKIRLNGDYKVLNCTDNHPILVRHQGHIRRKKWKKDKLNLSNPEYIRADRINTKTDFMFVPKRKGLQPCFLPDDLLYILGWYISDGNVSSGHYVKFFLHESQYEIGLDLVKILNKYWQRDKTYVKKRINKNGVHVKPYYEWHGASARIIHDKRMIDGRFVKMWKVEICSEKAQKFFIKYGGRPKHKDIAESIYNTTGLLPLIKGLFEGDGHYRCDIRNDGYERNSLELSSIYENLAIKIRQILIDMGIWSSIRFVKSRKQNRQDQYNLNITGDNVLPVIEGSKKFKQINRTTRKWDRETYIEDENGFWVKAKDYSLELYKGKTYNIEVENDHSYIADGITTHNCRSFGLLMIGRDECLMRSGGVIGQKKEEDNCMDDNLISQFLNGGKKRTYSNNTGFERYSREEVKRILNIDSDLKLYHYK